MELNEHREDDEIEDVQLQKRGSKRSSPTRNSLSTSSSDDNPSAPWEDTHGDLHRFDEANQAAEGTKRRRMHKQVKVAAATSDDDDELIDDDTLPTQTAIVAGKPSSRGRSKVIDDDDDE